MSTVSLPPDPPTTESLIVVEGEEVIQGVCYDDNSLECYNSPELDMSSEAGILPGLDLPKNSEFRFVVV